MDKSQTISKILKLTGKAGDPVSFEKLSDQSEQYLIKYLKAVEKL